MWSRVIIIGVSVACSALQTSDAVTLGQVDTFETSGLAGWAVGNVVFNPNPPAWVPNGGPLGIGDSHIQVEGNAETGSGSKPNVFNASQWIGNYLAAGVTAIELDVKYAGQGPETMQLRIGLEGPSGFVWSMHAEPIGPGTPSPWHHAVFPIDPANLGGGDPELVLPDVAKLWLYHAPIGGTPRNSPVLDVQIGYDNIRALPLFAADFDVDGDVDGDDFLAWQTGFGTQSGTQKSDGDYDNDRDVDGDDFLGWQAEFGSGSGTASAAVPEPTSVLLLLGVALVGMWRVAAAFDE